MAQIPRAAVWPLYGRQSGSLLSLPKTRASQLPNVSNDLAEWLSKHGLGQYAQTFAENNIEYALLPDLTEADLKFLGLSLGHRKTLFKAIEGDSLRQHPSTSSRPGPAGESTTSSHLEAEHRHITVLFCDLVDSTQLSETLEPEDLQIVITAYRDVCSAAIRRYGGWVARYMGDGVMAFFGWPHAHEDDAIRAVHAAIEAVSAITKIPGPVTLAARVGVSSGPVVVGEIGNASDTSSIDAVGETPNIAARLQTLATPNTILISEATRRLLAGAFEYHDLGRHELKGITKRLQVYRVIGANSLTSRFDAAHTDSLTPLVGRSTELNMLLDRWQKSKEGDGQVLLLSGLPGVGKSRLIHELKVQVQTEPHFLLNHQCSPYHSQSAFYPIIDQIERAAQIMPREPDDEKLEKLRAYLPGALGGAADPVQLIATLLSLSKDGQTDFGKLTPQQVKNRTVSALVDIFLAFSSELPTLCIFEDVHWIDPSTLELLELAISRIDRARVLLVISYRPDFRPTWFTRSNVTVHSLTRLSRSEVAGMVEAICLRERRMLQPILTQIIEKADGLPLFIEELTHSILSSMRNRIADSTTAPNSDQNALKVPDTLYDALMERLDRVPQGRRLTQTAAAIGREFSYELLSLALRIDENEMQLTLARLEDADIIYRVGISPQVLFAFKHALLRDAIYSSLLKSSRRQMHAELAAILETHFHSVVETQPEILAHHCSEAGSYELAVRYWHRAGQRALAHSANIEAIAHFRKALEALTALPDTSQRRTQEIELQLALGIPLIAVLGYAAEETREVFARARTLCLQVNSSDEYFQALFGLWGHSWMSGKNDEALSMANEFLSRAESSTQIVPLMVAHRVMGSTLLPIGQFQRSKQHFEESIALSKTADQQSLYSRYMVEPNTASLLLLSWDLWILGFPRQSLSRVMEALTLARELDHPYSVAFSHYMISVVHLLRGEPAEALSNAEASLEVSREQRFSLYALLSRISRGYALSGLGRPEEAKTEIRLGLDDMRSKGVGFMLPMMESWLADVLAQSGDNDAALSLVERSLVGLNDVTGRSWESELHLRKAQLLLALGPHRAREAQATLMKAIDVARLQGARSFELRVVASLASLLSSQGKNDEARSWLEPVYGWFAEGHDTQDLRHARDVHLAISSSDTVG
jgi:class 3 adenylate cyclase/tetratricopeptide (TPR) repeat protein